MAVGALPNTQSALWISLSIAIPVFFFFLLLCIDPDLPSSAFSFALQTWSAFNACLTPTVLFFLMNAVVCALALQSKVGYGGTARLNRPREADELDDEEEEDDDDEDGDRDEVEDQASRVSSYPELLPSFFGEEPPRNKRRIEKLSVSKIPSAKLRSNPNLKPKLRSTANPNPRLRPSLNQAPNSRALSQPSRPYYATTNPNKINGVIKGRVMSLSPINGYGEAADLRVEKSPALNPPSSRAGTKPESEPEHGYGGEKNIDERAGEFIDHFYNRRKVQEVDPYIERLERSYGS